MTELQEQQHVHAAATAIAATTAAAADAAASHAAWVDACSRAYATAQRTSLMSKFMYNLLIFLAKRDNLTALKQIMVGWSRWCANVRYKISKEVLSHHAAEHSEHISALMRNMFRIVDRLDNERLLLLYWGNWGRVCTDTRVINLHANYLEERRLAEAERSNLLVVIKFCEATILELQSDLDGCNVGDKAAMADVGCQTKRTLKLGVATQCDISNKNNDSFPQDALLHAERHIAKLETHLGAMERDAEDFESRVRKERDLAGRRFDELLRLRSALAGKARDELACSQ
jgi:hypothetical protein